MNHFDNQYTAGIVRIKVETRRNLEEHLAKQMQALGRLTQCFSLPEVPEELLEACSQRRRSKRCARRCYALQQEQKEARQKAAFLPEEVKRWRLPTPSKKLRGIKGQTKC
ncbi:hypothetical protein H105_06763 [Trichophyton soudanense CBS 452.61]|uniref:Uncharacterized protein n=1 Tax=Trichophyton soudanense CBS 452.61 TaxID=1215331 RepID=A0A022XL02_TRISD|nr:hypothetical protein H105_06763 [Trichophyton soudanense CBS 452.61]